MILRDAAHMRRLQEACRNGRIEVLYTVIENATVASELLSSALRTASWSPQTL
jgi:hypothetical protein